MAARYGLGFTSRHRALDDARVTSRLLLRMLDEAADRHNIATWDDLQRFLAPVRTRKRKGIHHKGTKDTKGKKKDIITTETQRAQRKAMRKA